MRTPGLAALLAALLATSACGNSSPASPFSGAPSLVEEAVGNSQSPIDILEQDVRNVGKQGLPALKFRYSRRADLSVANTGSPDEEATVRADVAPGDGELRLGGDSFQLLQFHFHTPSEHRVDGEEFPLEIHLVHRNAANALMVVGVLVREGAAHRELGRIFGDLPESPGAVEEVADFELPRVLPHVLESVRYSGSLTTPPFTEPVAWVVMSQPIEMSAAQIEEFQHLFEEGNTREPQPLNGRTVASDADGRGRN